MNHSTIRFALVRVAALALVTSRLAGAQIGANYCSPATPNSTGASAVISGSGSAVVPLNNLILTSTGLPLNISAFFLCSRTTDLVQNPGGSAGNLCLGNPIGRLVGGAIVNSGATGIVTIAADLTATPQPTGPVMVQPGETWSFQCWYRDSFAGGATSNFSDGIRVLFTATQTPSGLRPIPPGTFLMGSNATSGFPYFVAPTEQPVHQVTISYPFWMGQYEVTQAEYQALTGVNPSWFQGASRPVDSVSWNEARAFCAALTAQQAGNLPTGYQYRLPTEAEWEYACRAGAATEFHYGPDLFCNQAWIGFSNHSNSSCNSNGHTSVGSYAPNAFGLYDMHGNVGEWCLDSAAVYPSGPVTDPFVTGGANKMVRGGNWSVPTQFCRTASRGFFVPLFGDNSIGFRVVLAPILIP